MHTNLDSPSPRSQLRGDDESEWQAASQKIIFTKHNIFPLHEPHGAKIISNAYNNPGLCMNGVRLLFGWGRGGHKLKIGGCQCVFETFRFFITLCTPPDPADMMRLDLFHVERKMCRIILVNRFEMGNMES